MATDREAARRARLRGAGRDLATDADTSFGFGLLPASNTTSAANNAALQAVSENAASNSNAKTQAPTTAPTPRRGRTGIGGVKRASPALAEDNQDAIKRQRLGRADPYDLAEAPELAQRQGGPLEGISNTVPLPATIEAQALARNDTRMQDRNQRLRGAQTRSPGVVDFSFNLPPAPAPTILPVATTAPTSRVLTTPAAMPSVTVLAPDLPPASAISPTQSQTTTPAPIVSSSLTRTPSTPTQSASAQRTRDAVTPEFQVIDGSTIRSSTGHSQIFRSSRRASRQTSIQEVTESPRDRPGSGRRVVRSSPTPTRAAGREAAMIERATDRFQGVMGTPTRTGRRQKSPEVITQTQSQVSPTLTVKGGENGAATPQRRETEDKDEMDVDELSPDASRRRDREREQDSVIESVELSSPSAAATPIYDAEAARQLNARRAAKGKEVSYVDRQAVEVEEDSHSSEYEESDVEAGSVAAAKRGRGRPKKFKRGDKRSPAVQKIPTNKTAARNAASAPQSSGALPVAKRRGRPPGSKNGAGTKSISGTKRRKQDMGPRSKETIAIQTYRLNSPPPGIKDNDDDELANPILSAPIPQPSRDRKSGGVNSIDVLRQILNEVLQSALESLERGAGQADDAARRDPTEEKVEERREYRTKLRAVEAWSEVVDGELGMLGLNLDAGWGVTRRVKSKEVERHELRQRLLEVRAERERVGVRADAVRTRHEIEGVEADSKRRTNVGLQDVETLVAMAKEGPGKQGEIEEEPMDKLKTVVELVSRRDGKAGLLGRLRYMNALLERAAQALEGR